MFGAKPEEISKAISDKLNSDKKDTKEGVDLLGLAKTLAKRNSKKSKKK